MKKIYIFLSFFFSFFLFTSNVFAQGGDNCAAADAVQITSLPYTNTKTTASWSTAINDYNNVGPVPAHTTGLDWVYSFLAPTTGRVISFINIQSSGLAWFDKDLPSISIWQGCPNSGTCIGFYKGYVNVNEIPVEADVTAGQTYYIMIDGNASPSYGFQFSLRYIPVQTIQPSCTNIGFESGITGWSGTYGKSVQDGLPGAFHPVYKPVVYGTNAANHSIMTGGNDPLGGFPRVNPSSGNTRSLRLGDTTISGCGGATIEQKFKVELSNALFTYYYALVFQNPAHTQVEQPFFKAEVLDSAGNESTCGQYFVYANDDLPEFTQVPSTNPPVYYKSWTPVGVDLSPFVGKTIIVRFTVSDCSESGHYAYAYIDAACAPLELVDNQTICAGQTAILNAPPGDYTYEWTSDNPMEVISNNTSQSISVSPTTQTEYTVKLSTSISGCDVYVKDTVFITPSLQYADAGNNTSFCSTFNDTIGVAPISGRTYSWSPSTGLNFTNIANPIVTLTNSTSNPIVQTYTVTTVVDACTSIDSVTVTVNPIPVADAGSPLTVCSDLAGAIGVSSTGGYNYSWSPSTGLNFTNISNPSVTLTNTGVSAQTYTYTVTTSAGTCSSTDDVVVTVNPAPVVDAGNPIAVCSNNAISVPVSATINGATGGTWGRLGTGGFTDANATTTTYAPTAADIALDSIKLFITSTGNGVCNAVTDTVTLSFTAAPTVDITSNDSICAGITLPISATSSTGSGDWQSVSNGTTGFVLGGGGLTGSYTTSTSEENAGTARLIFTSTNNGGCNPVRDTLDVVLLNSPAPDFALPLTACSLDSLTFNGTATGAGSIVSWTWNFGDGTSTQSAQNLKHSFATSGSYDIVLNVVSNSGCLDTVTKTVIVSPDPVAGFNLTSNCLADGTIFTDNSTIAGSTITSWNWSFGSAAVPSTTTGQGPHNIKYPSGGTYPLQLTVRSAMNCESVLTQNITVAPNPVANFDPDDYTAKINQIITFTDKSVKGSADLDEWNWDFGDNSSTSTQKNPTHAYSKGGLYRVRLIITDGNGCTDTIYKEVMVLLDPAIPTGFSPNGDGENDTFYVYGGPFKSFDFKIYNNWGELIFESTDQLIGWDGKRKGVDQPLGVYVYIFVGLGEDDKEYRLSGDVTLLR